MSTQLRKTKTLPLSYLSVFAVVFALALTLGLPIGSHAQTENESSEASNPDYEQLKQEIVREVIDELRNTDVLQEAVQDGIREFIERQRQAQAEAREQQQRRAEERAQNVRPVSAERDHIYGNPDATISLVEYSDFECPYCKRFHPTAKALVDQSDGEINLVYRHFPLSFHNPGAQTQAEASECAAELGGNEAFWTFTDAIYERTASGGKGFPRDQLVPLAVEVGLDKTAFQECFESGRHKDRVLADFTEGQRIGITGTPGNILLNNETGKALMRAGAQPLGALQGAVETLKESDESS